MKEQYARMMEGQELSQAAQMRFRTALAEKMPRRRTFRAVAAAVCVCLMLPVTVFAADKMFDLGVVEILSGETEGYRMSFNHVYSYPITDFSEEVRMSEELFRSEAYDSWEEAEETIGIDLMKNAFFSESGIRPVRKFILDPEKNGAENRAHCYADYFADSGQLYRAVVTAAYERERTHITVRATVTAEHPVIAEDEEALYHSAGKLYGTEYIKEITEEEYTAASGLTASVVRTEWDALRAPDYEAVFAVDGISWQVRVSGYPVTPEGEEKAKAMLIEILEGF
ncbi:MAG: hypothetical protein IKM31_08750 [Oscillospiraceae bacterium]|nr:hypothetical protein [Oscillospiraceae bacterium]